MAVAPRAGAATGAVWARLAQDDQRPPARTQFGMAIDARGTLYVYGGRGPGGTVINDFWSLGHAAAGWQRLATPIGPPLIEPHLAVDAAGDVFEFGGISPGAPGIHLTADYHSFGLYEYAPAGRKWLDLTAPASRQGVDWPPGREDHGFAYEPATGDLYVFAGEGVGNVSLNDMWRYDGRSNRWSAVRQRVAGPSGIDAREIYNISPDGHGGIYLFGGAYVFTAAGKRVPWTYINDLWRFDIAAGTWHLVAGIANTYDPAMPLPRHYYGQACDAQGNFYILGGYVSDTVDPPYFSDDATNLYAQVSVFTLPDIPTGWVQYAVADFWRYGAQEHRWDDLSAALGDLRDQPFIPYVMVADPTTPRLIIYGGFYTNVDGELQAGDALRGFPIPAGTSSQAAAAGTPTPGVR